MPSWENNVRRVVPYTPGEQPKDKNIIKLNTNENPYPPSPAVAEALKKSDAQSLRLYPDPAASELVSAIAKYEGLPEDQVFVGVGSDDVIAMSFMTFFASGRPILFPDISYSFYEVWADMLRIPYEAKALDEDFKIRPRDYFCESGGIIFPNPNAPTGILMSIDSVREILEHNRDVVVIVDEAYIDFADDVEAASAKGLISEYENLLVVRTFSKSRSMAGMRIGYAMGSAKLIKYLSDVKYSFNSYTMSRVSIEAGAAAISDDAYFQKTREQIIKTRERAAQALKELGFTVLKSSSNFLFASHKSVPARQLFKDLREAGIIVRYFDKPRIDNYLRITVGTDEQMNALLRFLRTYLA